MFTKMTPERNFEIKQGDIYSFHPKSGETLEEWVDESQVEIDVLAHDNAKPCGTPICIVGISLKKHEHILKKALEEKNEELLSLVKKITDLKTGLHGMRAEAERELDAQTDHERRVLIEGEIKALKRIDKKLKKLLLDVTPRLSLMN